MNTPDLDIIFSSPPYQKCFNLQTLEDIMVEPMESFNLSIDTNDKAIRVGANTVIWIVDNDVTVRLDRTSYSGPEGENISICALVTSDTSNIHRKVLLRILTVEGSAEGIVSEYNVYLDG